MLIIIIRHHDAQRYYPVHYYPIFPFDAVLTPSDHSNSSHQNSARMTLNRNEPSDCRHSLHGSFCGGNDEHESHEHEMEGDEGDHLWRWMRLKSSATTEGPHGHSASDSFDAADDSGLRRKD